MGALESGETPRNLADPHITPIGHERPLSPPVFWGFRTKAAPPLYPYPSTRRLRHTWYWIGFGIYGHGVRSMGKIGTTNRHGVEMDELRPTVRDPLHRRAGVGSLRVQCVKTTGVGTYIRKYLFRRGIGAMRCGRGSPTLSRSTESTIKFRRLVLMSRRGCAALLRCGNN